ncbi:MAG TPA: quinone-dependent dihydroorotate dehydrogenase [Burkholderiales bacterium]|nr:quinone-dependent dihydroorotate dehydrogenase [Burkholderiales bacterium]
MSAYALARPLLFSLDPETAHHLALSLARFSFRASVPDRPVTAMGIRFPNPVGLAAGLDKDAAHVDGLARLGFGFIEVGTVTPLPQAGNPRPRLFRLEAEQAVINRFGFNNVGVDAFVANASRAHWKGILGINIGKNAATPPDRAADDYAFCLEKVYGHASYVTVNISSPNTKGLRDLQQEQQLEQLLARLASVRDRLARVHGKRVPLVLKVAPDLQAGEIETIAATVLRHRIDGLIATNTSITREGVSGSPRASEAGGLSGAPILGRSTAVLASFRDHLAGKVALIGAGGILSADDARQKADAGASLVQLYTGLIYRGPALVRECVSAFPAT